MSSGIQTVFGAANLMNPEREADFPQHLDLLEQKGVRTLDTAQLYGNSEAIIGKVGASKRFIVDTKWQAGFKPKETPQENVVEEAKKSLSRLATDQVHIYYIHSPPSNEMEEYLGGINELHKSGAFKRFGLSNFKVEDVQKIYDYNKSKGYVLPSAYQGNYGPVARRQEKELFPTLRKLGISFYAYSPLAGGFLTKTKQDIIDGKGRFDKNSPLGQLYLGLYSKPSYLEALAEWESIAKEANVSRAELAYRWVKYNSPLKSENGDAIIIGASNLSQLEQTLNGLENGPLAEETVKAIDDVWSKIKDEAPLDNYHG